MSLASNPFKADVGRLHTKIGQLRQRTLARGATFALNTGGGLEITESRQYFNVVI